MKNLKKLTYIQKQKVSSLGLNPIEWGVVSKKGNVLTIMNRSTKETKDVYL
jgi:hypothetical protein